MKKPAIIKEKAKKDILRPLRRKAAPKNAAVTVSAVTSDPATPAPKKLKLGTVLGVCLLVCSVLYLLMLVSYNQADPSFSHAAPNATPKNLIGLVGAWVSDIALFALGWSAYWLVPVGLMCAWRYLYPHYKKAAFGKIIHLFGLALLLCASTSLEALRLYYLAEPLPGLSGGVLGQALMTASVPVVGALGMTILMVIFALWGAAIFFDFSWLSVAEKIGTRLERVWHILTNRHEAKVEEKKVQSAKEELVQQVLQEPVKVEQIEAEPKTAEKEEPPVAAPAPTPAPAPRPVINPQATVKQSEVALEAQQDSLFEDTVAQPVRPSLKLFDPAGNSEPSISYGTMS